MATTLDMSVWGRPIPEFPLVKRVTPLPSLPSGPEVDT